MNAARLILLAGLLALASCRSSGDRLEVPTPKKGEYVAMRLNSVFAANVNHIFLGGYLTRLDGSTEGVLLMSQDRGQSWSRIGGETYPMVGFMVQAIHFNDPVRGWIAGVRVRQGETIPVVLKTTDGGGHWRETEIPETRAAVVESLRNLDFDSDRIGSVEVVFQEEGADDLTGNVYLTRDGGRNWTLGDFGGNPSETVTDPAEMFFSEAQGYRILPPIEDGIQILEYTGSAGKNWVPRAQLSIAQFDLFY